MSRGSQSRTASWNAPMSFSRVRTARGSVFSIIERRRPASGAPDSPGPCCASPRGRGQGPDRHAGLGVRLAPGLGQSLDPGDLRLQGHDALRAAGRGQASPWIRRYDLNAQCPGADPGRRREAVRRARFRPDVYRADRHRGGRPARADLLPLQDAPPPRADTDEPLITVVTFGSAASIRCAIAFFWRPRMPPEGT